MALQLDWIDNKTGVTYEDAYAIIGRILYTKLNNNSHQFVAKSKSIKTKRQNLTVRVQLLRCSSPLPKPLTQVITRLTSEISLIKSTMI